MWLFGSYWVTQTFQVEGFTPSIGFILRGHLDTGGSPGEMNDKGHIQRQPIRLLGSTGTMLANRPV